MPETLDLHVERPVAGGWMLARYDGGVAFVSRAIPGERVRARVTRRTKHAVFTDVVEILEASPFRRQPPCDARCGGLAYAHIAPDHHGVLKGQVIADALRRLGGLEVEPPEVLSSPERGWRLRARLHVRDGRAGFFLEGSHQMCDAAATGQLRPETLPLVQAWLDAHAAAVASVDAVVVAETIDATGRLLHLEPHAGARLRGLEDGARLADGLTGITLARGARLVTLAGEARIRDTAANLFHGAPPIAPSLAWARSGAAFFQGNRFLTGPLVGHVLAHVAGPRVLDLYSGVGLFAGAMAASGTAVTAVEGDPWSGDDLARNAATWGDRVTVEQTSVEEAVARHPAGHFATIVLDPPRTGASPDALAGVVRLAPSRLVYVSCDPPTLGRDTRRLVAAGYRVDSVAGFDLFPNTGHVETIAVFRRA